MNRFPDDWGSALGEDGPKPPAPKKKPKQESLTGLVYHFSNSLPVESMNRLSSPVNGPAMMKAFKKLLAEGFTHGEIRGMIDDFSSRLKAKPLKPEVLPWRAFLGDLDSLASAQRTANPQEDYGTWGVDSRLLED
jgi:hypothetical protein